MPWLSLTLQAEAAVADLLSDALIEAGAHSAWVDEPDRDPCRIGALLALDAEPGTLVAQAARIAGLPAAPPFSVTRLEDDDWVRRTQAQFQPIGIDGRLWIVPTWLRPTPDMEAAALVRLDPGLAFGTGSHPTTRLVLGYLARTLRGGERVLDYGCGSGILAIAAAKLGASHVDAVDVDPEAVATTIANAELNGIALSAKAPDELQPGRYDLVVSNILAQPLILLAPLLAARTAARGRIALSGVLASQAEEVAGAYAPYFDAGPGASSEGWALVEGTRR